MSDENRQRPAFVVNQGGVRSEFIQGKPQVVLPQSNQGPALIGVVSQGNGLFSRGECLVLLSSRLDR